jgi:hypothetical protein
MTQSASLSSSSHAYAALELAAITPIDVDIDGEPLVIQDARTIVSMLQNLAVQMERVTVYPADGEPVPGGRLVAFQEATQDFVLQVQDDREPAAGPGVLVVQPRGMKAQFEGELAWQAHGAGTWRCALPLPLEILQTQRRRFTRQDIPLAPALLAVFSQSGRRREFQLDDLSLGGVGLRAPAHEHRDLLARQRLDRVRLELGPSQWLDVDLEICSRRTFRSFLAGEQLQLGCRFVNLSPAARATLAQLLADFELARSAP